MPTEEGIKICGEYGIQIPVQSAFINWPQEPDSYLSQILGERSERLNPLKSFADVKIMLSAGSDGPCTDPDPIDWLHKACNHSVPQQSLTVQQALKMCTYNSYAATFDEKDRGSLEVGKIADMVILSANPYDINVSQLNTLKVEHLILGGQPYQKLKINPLAQIIKGFLKK